MAKHPSIRFNDFSDEWEEKQLNNFIEPSYETNKDNKFTKDDVLSVSGEEGIVNQIEFKGRSFAGEFVDNYGVVNTGYIVYTKSPLKLNPYGIIKTNKGKPGIVSTLYAIYKPINNTYPDFVQEYFGCDQRLNKYLVKLVNKGAKNDMKVSSEEAISGLVSFPNRDEQIKLSIFFNYITKLIFSTQEKLEKAIILKKSMLEKMFPKVGEKSPELRFAGFTDDWKEKELGNYAEKITEKNTDNQYSDVFTNSAEYGIISQNEYFEREIANKNNLSGYYVAKPDVFVYNPRVSKTAPVGPIKRNKLGRTGVLSPLYFVFQTHDYDLSFLDYFFDGNTWHQFMRDNGNTGARFDRFSINEDSFLKMPIPTPSREEQKQIGTFFVQMDSLIYSYRNELEKLKIIKKSLLEKMFV